MAHIMWLLLKIKRTIHISKFVDWESNPKLLFQIIYDQTYNHDFTKLTIHKFNNRFCLTLTDCFSFLPPQSNFRTYYRTFSSYYRLSLSNFKKIRETHYQGQKWWIEVNWYSAVHSGRVPFLWIFSIKIMDF